MADPRCPSLRFGPVVPIAMATLEDVKPNVDLQGLLGQARMYPVSFGEQRSIQLSYGRLSASIDETPASGNRPDFAGWMWREPPSAKFGSLNRLWRARRLCAESVPGVTITGSPS